MLFNKLCILALAAHAVASPAGLKTRQMNDPKKSKDDYVLIGYRTVDKATYFANKWSWDKLEADAINNDEFTLFLDPQHDGLGELGRGKSLSPGPRQYNPARLQQSTANEAWVCYVLAVKAKMQETKKAWIPPSHADKGTETAIQQYINSGKISDESKKWDARETLRFSLLCKGDCPELLIPEKLLPSKGGQGNELGITAECFKTLEELEKGMKEVGFSMETLDYTTKGWGVEGPRL